MGFGFGPGADMLKSFKQNRGKLGVHAKEKQVSSNTYEKNSLTFKKATQEQLDAIRKSKAEENKRNLLLLFSIILVISLILLFIM